MFKIAAVYVPPPTGIPSPTSWGEEVTARERLREGITDMQLTPMLAALTYPFSPAETVEFYRTFLGSTKRVFASLQHHQQDALRRDLVAHWTPHNQAMDGTTHVEAEFLEVVATRASSSG